MNCSAGSLVLSPMLSCQKLDVPDGLQPTASDKRGWFINPMGIKQKMPVWAMFGACIPAMLLFILIFMEMQITRSVSSWSLRLLLTDLPR